METVKIYCQEVGKGNPQLTYATNKIIPKLPAFYPDGKELPKGWKGEAELVWQYKWPNYKWDKCTDNDPKYAIDKGYETRQAYLAIMPKSKEYDHNSLGEVLGFQNADASISPVGENDQHTDVEALAEKSVHPTYKNQYDSLKELKDICDKKIKQYEDNKIKIAMTAEEILRKNLSNGDADLGCDPSYVIDAMMEYAEHIKGYTAALSKNEGLLQALKEITHASYSGSAESTIVDIKAIASKAINSLPEAPKQKNYNSVNKT